MGVCGTIVECSYGCIQDEWTCVVGTLKSKSEVGALHEVVIIK